MISGLVTLAAFVSFIGIATWAWSRHNRERFDEASRLPLDEEHDASRSCGDRSPQR